MGDLKTKYEPKKLKDIIDDRIPAIKYNPKTGKFTRSDGNKLDSLPRIIKSWYKKNLCVRIDTYGGGGEDGGDLACLFYSSGRAVLPELADIEYSEKYAKVSQNICHNFKANMASFCLSRTGEDIGEIKLRHTLSDGANFNKYIENFINSDYFIKYGEEKIKKDFKRAILERNELLELGVVEKEELFYDEIKKGLVEYYPDPRERKVNSSTTGGIYEQYFWPAELRQLPIDTGIFTISSIFNNSEWDIREEELGSLAPTCGDISFTTLIDQLLTKKMYGLDFFRLIANVTGFNIFLLEPNGEPHIQKCVTRTSTNVDILSLTVEKLKNSKIHYENSDYNPDCPCVVILFQSAHFETVAILHEMEENIYQAQTVFSFYDPFIQAIIERSEGKKEFVPEEINYSEMSIDEIIKLLDKETEGALSKKELREQAILLKNGGESSDEDVKDLKDMTTDEAIIYLNKTTPNWKDFLEKGTKPRDYAREMVKMAKKKK